MLLVLRTLDRRWLGPPSSRDAVMRTAPRDRRGFVVLVLRRMEFTVALPENVEVKAPRSPSAGDSSSCSASLL